MNFFDLKEKSVNIGDHKMSYIDEGSPQSTTVLLLHGVPTWSYIYRNIIKHLLDLKFRVIAPDLIGFGRSDKVEKASFHSFGNHLNSLSQFIDLLGLKELFVFGQDWGALFAMGLAVERENSIKGLILSNGYIPRGNEKQHIKFRIWQILSRYATFIPVGFFVDKGSIRKLDKEEKRNYSNPFYYIKSKTGLRTLPWVLPFIKGSSDEKKAKEIWKRLEKLKKPLVTAFSDRDPITRGGDKILQKHIPGTSGQKHMVLKGGHFIMEDAPLEIAGIIIDFIKKHR